MAIIRSIFGGPSGKIGPVVCAVYNGKAVIRSLPVRRQRPYSEKELKQQARFTAVHYFLKPLISYIRVGFKGSTAPGNAYNACKSYTLKNAVTEGPGGAVILPEKVLLSVGRLAVPAGLCCTVLAGGALITWNAEKYDVPPGTLLMIAVLNSGTGEAMVNLAAAFANTGYADVKLQEQGVYHLWVSFNVTNCGDTTPSQYFNVAIL